MSTEIFTSHVANCVRNYVGKEHVLSKDMLYNLSSDEDMLLKSSLTEQHCQQVKMLYRPNPVQLGW